MVRAKNICKKYGNKNNEFFALKDINFSIEKGEFVFITGKSGSGKSTLLHLLAGIDKPTSGEVVINNTNLYSLSSFNLTCFRRKNIGVVYQFYNLFPMLSVLENIKLPFFLDGKKANEKRCLELIRRLDLLNVRNKYPNDLSGGEQQRTAIGRALVIRPRILLLDEPTGNLDSKNTIKVMKLLKFYNNKYRQTIIMVTHDESLVRNFGRNIVMRDGEIIKDETF